MPKRILFTGALLALLFNLAGADIPGLINFQGILTDASAVPLANDTNSVLFTIYDAVAGGNPKWSETQSVVTDGLGRFSVLLGEVNAIEDTVFKQPDRWLEIKIGSDPVMIPRTRLASVPYSFLSDSTQAAGGASGWVDDGSVVRLSNSTDNVGMGTTSPIARLHIRGSSPARGIIIENDSFVNSDDIRIKRPGLEGAGSPRFSITQRSSNTDLWLYGYDGTTFKNFIGFHYATNAVSMPADGSNLYIDNANSRVGIGTTSPNSRLQVNGAIATAATLTVSNLTLDESHSIVVVEASSGAKTITLPSTAGISGRQYVIKKVDATANSVTINPALGAQTIDGAASYTLSAMNMYVVLVTNGSLWFVIGNN